MDIETFTHANKLFPYCICLKMNSLDVVFWYSDHIVMDFLNYISENAIDDNIVIYTHNLNFDGLIIIDYIKDKNILFDLFVRDNNIYWIKIVNMKITILIRCSYKIIPLSINKLGALINLEKKTFPYKFVNINNLSYVGTVPNSDYFNSIEDYEIFIKNHKIFDLKKIAIDYCIRDIDIIFEVLTSIINIINNQCKSTSVLDKSFSFSSISYKIYCKKFDNWRVGKNKILNFDSDYIRNGYYGGRCEVFGNPRDGDIVHYFDFRGMYAQCMLEKFPIGPIIRKNSNLSVYNIGFHTIKFKCDAYLPFLPVRANKLLFPNGVHIGTYWYEEIVNAIKNNKCSLLDHYSSYEFENEDFVFKDYVNEYMSIRDKGIYYNIFGKNMINGLYGSFALNDEDYTYVITLSEVEFKSYCERLDIISFKKIGNAFIIKLNKNNKSKKILDKKNIWDLEHKKRNVTYSAIIASKARIKLNNSLNLVIANGGDLYYTDTDSIFAGFKSNNINCQLGDINWSNVYEDAVFISSKFYYIKNENIKIKGVNKNSYSFNEIKNMFYSNKISDIRFTDQLSFLKNNFELFEIIGEKNVKIGEYDKRIFIENKKKTIPVELNIPD